MLLGNLSESKTFALAFATGRRLDDGRSLCRANTLWGGVSENTLVVEEDGLRLLNESLAIVSRVGGDGSWIGEAEYDCDGGDRIAWSEVESGWVKEAWSVLLLSQVLGALVRVTDSAIAYADLREQFGRKIRSFQRVQDLICIAVEETLIMSGLLVNCITMEEQRLSSFNISLTSSHARQCVRRVVQAVHQTYGAMGFTEEAGIGGRTSSAIAWSQAVSGLNAWEERTLELMPRQWIGMSLLEREGEEE
ncbi:acyl-CoA dehydrogenase family protein [Ornithinimicrobium cryptoxanthini]|uniref:acyl-CoA dehydrogenase family protein n=1 Tax=Ornithinimicrobium cryptoxanthini TaxID=2934161 RepID=UPI00351CA246